MTNQTTSDGYFEINGYSKDYYLDGKYIGSIPLDEPDRETFSYYGRRYETTTEDIYFTKTKKIKKGSTVMTDLQIICGRKK